MYTVTHYYKEKLNDIGKVLHCYNVFLHWFFLYMVFFIYFCFFVMIFLKLFLLILFFNIEMVENLVL